MTLNPEDFIITRKRKLYKFAVFANSPLCVEFEDWESTDRVDILEIGAGTGLFSVALAAANPELQVVAVDVKGDRLQTGARLAEAQGLTNIRFLRARADQLLECFSPGSLQTVWVTFPDPFPKKGSAGRRLTHPTFLRIYQQLLGPAGVFRFKTDAAPLFQWTLEQLVAKQWAIEQLSFDLHDSSLDASYKVKTTYETKFTAQGLPTHFVQATPPAL